MLTLAAQVIIKFYIACSAYLIIIAPIHSLGVEEPVAWLNEPHPQVLNKGGGDHDAGASPVKLSLIPAGR
jgi:hypothetical protein